MKFNISGLSKKFCEGLEELSKDYEFKIDDSGIAVKAESSDALRVKKDETILKIEYVKESEFYRGFILSLNKPSGYKREERASIERLGLMADNSRNAVFNMETSKKLVRTLAVCGYNYLKLYTEDTYEIEGEPYFGYLRGRHSAKDIKELDSYASVFGIELIPCIQTLAHLNGITRHKAYLDIIDCNDILLIDDDKTYALIDKMFAFAAENFKSRKINIGMDEAHMVGLGKFLDKHGYQNRFELMSRHLKKVLELADKYGFTCSMWSDMFFRLVSGGAYYTENPEIPDEVVKLVPANVNLVYWDYYHQKESDYDTMTKAHKKFNNKIEFAGGAWKWSGFAPNNIFSLKAVEPAMTNSIKHKIADVMLTSWGDNGAECSIFAILPTLIYASEKRYSNPDYKETFKDITGCDFDDFMLLDYPNGRSIKKIKDTFSNFSKIFLYNDCFLGNFDSMVSKEFSVFYKYAIKVLRGVAAKGGPYQYLFDTSVALTDAVAEKHDIGVVLREAYKTGDKDALRNIANKKMSRAIKKLEKFYEIYRVQWLKENTPFGLEVQDIRLGGAIQRLKACRKTVLDYCNGSIPSIAELEAEILPVDNYRNGEYMFNLWTKNVTMSLM